MVENIKQNKYSTEALLAEFFAQDDLKSLAADAGVLLECPLLVLDDTFHVAAYYRPLGFSDPLFQASVSRGEITYEAERRNSSAAQNGVDIRFLPV